MSTTQVSIVSHEIRSVVARGLRIIEEARKEALSEEIDSMMAQKKWTLRGRKPKYDCRLEALSAMKASTSGYWGVSRHHIITKWSYEGDETRLLALRSMADAAVDNRVLIGYDDHKLLRSYAQDGSVLRLSK